MFSHDVDTDQCYTAKFVKKWQSLISKKVNFLSYK